MGKRKNENETKNLQIKY